MITIGLDLGQQQDHSALAVVEREERPFDWMPTQPTPLRVRHLERMPLGTPYTQVVSRIAKILEHPKLASGARLLVDATGLGRPVLDFLRAAHLPGSLTAITITGGDAATHRGSEWHVPKRDLISGVLVLLEQSRLKLSITHSLTATLLAELAAIQLNYVDHGPVQIAGAPHDDLAIALALACWKPYATPIGLRNQRLTGI